MAQWYDIFTRIFIGALIVDYLCLAVIFIRKFRQHGMQLPGLVELDPVDMKILKYAGLIFLFGLLNFTAYLISLYYF